MKEILRFALPLSATMFLQILFKELGLAVAGKLCGDLAVSTIGATSVLHGMVMNGAVALAIGIDAAAAFLSGSRQGAQLSSLLHTWRLLLGLLGLALCGGLLLCADWLLARLETPQAILAPATGYFRIFCLGVPALLLFQGGAATLRGCGNTVAPLKCQVLAGLLNLALDVLLLRATAWGAYGVAVAGVASQYAACLFVSRCLRRAIPAEAGGARWSGALAKRILRIGVPACLQSLIFSASNLSVQTAVNHFGAYAVAGNTAAAGLQAVVDSATASYEITALRMVSSRLGAGQPGRVRKEVHRCAACAACVGALLGLALVCAPEWGLRIYVKDAESLFYGAVRVRIVCGGMLLCGVAEAMTGALRGLGCAVPAMLISLAAGCGLRVVWAELVVRYLPDFRLLMLSFPVSWLCTVLAMYVLYRAKETKIT